MTEDEIIERIRRGIKEPKARASGPGGISDSISQAINLLSMKLTAASPEYFEVRTSLASTNNQIFAIPAACDRLVRVWDMNGNAVSITGASSSGGLINVLAVDHGLVDDDIALIHDVLGTTEANGTWKVTYVDDDNITLNGSTFANAWVSGGKVFKEDQDFSVIERMPASEATQNSVAPYKWYMRGSNIVVDYTDYDNDIIILYKTLLDDRTEIPAKFHMGIVAYAVIDLIQLPATDSVNYSTYKRSYDFHMGLWKEYEGLAETFRPAIEDVNLSNVERIKKGWI